MRRVCVNVKNSLSYACGGYAYDGVPGISNAPPESEYLITIRLGPPEMFPATLPHKKRSLPRVFACWREGVVGIAAHEGRHIEQYRRALPRSEVDCERFEAWMLDRYRTERPEHGEARNG